jgi:hypothetical protein
MVDPPLLPTRYVLYVYFDRAIIAEVLTNEQVNGSTFTIPYWLADGIYPTHHCFVKAISNPTTRKQKKFSTMQESKRKDIERAFGMLQARFHILTTPCRLWSRDTMYSVMKTCVVLHNLILDYEKHHAIDSDYIHHQQYQPKHPFTVSSRSSGFVFTESEAAIEASRIRDAGMHRSLRDNLVEHIWNHVGGTED